MGPVTAQLLDELGYDPDVPEVTELELSGLAAGSIVRARDGARSVAVARLASGRLIVVDDLCPHDGGRISDGFVEGDSLVCARHGWELSIVPEVRGARCERRRADCERLEVCKLRE